MLKLDSTDLQIIRDLQVNGRMTNVELAKNAGISAPPCLRRVRQLEEAGIIQGYHADLNADALGFGVSIFAQVGLSSQNDTDLRAFEERVQQWPLVRECHMIAGDTDFLLRIVAHDWDEYQRFLSTQLTTAPNVTSVKSKFVLRSAKKACGVPIECIPHNDMYTTVRSASA